MVVAILGVAAVAVMLLNVGVIVKMLLVLERLEMAADINAATQAAIQAAARVVAVDLQDRYIRADAVEEGHPGEAADVAARSQPES